jgi:uncharacterized membrane protein
MEIRPRMSGPKDETATRRGLLGRLRLYLLTGLLVLAPSAVTVWVLIWLFNRVDNLLGRYLRFEFLDYRRVPGLGLLATLVLLVLVGWVASWIGARPLVRMWDMLLTRIPGIGIVYGSTKSLGEALLSQKEEAFRQVVLIPWPHPGMWRVGFITGRPGPDVSRRLASEIEVVFVPHTPNPASGFVHYVPRKDIVYLDWPIEDGLKVIVSGGVVQPDMERVNAGRAAKVAESAAKRAPAVDAADAGAEPAARLAAAGGGPAEGAPAGGAGRSTDRADAQGLAPDARPAEG